MADRRYKLIGQGLPGSAAFKVADLTQDDQIKWDDTLGKWVIGTIAPAGTAWGDITGTLSDQTDLQAALDLKLDAADAITDHGALTGLGDNDHPQYTRASAAETISGLWTHSEDMFFSTPGNVIRQISPSATFSIQGTDSLSAVKDMFKGDPDNFATMYHAGLPAVSTDASGGRVIDTDGDDPRMRFYSDAAIEMGYLQMGVPGGCALVNLVNSTNTSFTVTNTGGTSLELLRLNPELPRSTFFSDLVINGTLSYTGSLTSDSEATFAESVTITGPATGTAGGQLSLGGAAALDDWSIGTASDVLNFTHDDGTPTNTLVLSSGGAFLPGVLRADGGVFVNATQGITTPTGGFGTVQTTGAGTGGWEGFSIDGRIVFMHDGASAWGIYNDVDNEFLIGGNLNGTVRLYYNNVSEIETLPNTDDYNVSGGQVKDHNNVFRPIGFNLMPISEKDANDTFSETQVGRMVHRDGTANITYTLASGTSGAVPPVGATIMITNEGVSGLLTISAAGTLRWFNGSATAAPPTGNRQLTRGGVCTVYKYSSTEWWIWGVGIT